MSLQTEQNNLPIQSHFISIASCANMVSAWLMLCEDHGITSNSIHGVIESADTLLKIAKRILPFVKNAEALKLKMPVTLDGAVDQSDVFEPTLDFELLIERIKQGGDSGQFLADAYISAYRGKPFKHNLKEVVKLDSDALQLFFGIVGMRHVPGWDDNTLYEIEQQIISIFTGEDK